MPGLDVGGSPFCIVVGHNGLPGKYFSTQDGPIALPFDHLGEVFAHDCSRAPAR